MYCLFQADRPDRLSASGQRHLNDGIAAGRLACAAITLWEIAVPFRKKRLILPPEYTPVSYMEDIIKVLRLKILLLIPTIAGLAEKRHHNP